MLRYIPATPFLEAALQNAQKNGARVGSLTVTIWGPGPAPLSLLSVAAFEVLPRSKDPLAISYLRAVTSELRRSLDGDASEKLLSYFETLKGPYGELRKDSVAPVLGSLAPEMSTLLASMKEFSAGTGNLQTLRTHILDLPPEKFRLFLVFLKFSVCVGG